MIFYCDKCHMLSEQDNCKFCSKKHLKSPENNDYCFLFEIGTTFGEMFEGILKNENIPYSVIPSGNGVRSCFGLRLENVKIYVPFCCFYKAKALLNETIFNFEDQNIDLKNSIDKLFVSERNEKKIRKILDLNKNDNFINYCANIIINSDRITNEGRISSCLKGGEYLFVYKNDVIITVNSATYELLSAKKH